MSRIATPRNIYNAESEAIAAAQERSDANGAPVAVWFSWQGFFFLSEDPDFDANGYTLVALVNPTEVR